MTVLRHSTRSLAGFLLISASLALAQQQCYYGPGEEFRAPPDAELVPCMSEGNSACCRLGDTCLSGNTCYNYQTGDLYQYGCTDVSYKDASCPYKCGWDPTKSPWVALEYCTGDPSVQDTWVCHAPESCGCQWNATWNLLQLTPRGCQDMGSEARVALYAPSALAPYVSLPSTFGGTTLYYSGTTVSGTSTWITTALKGYTPKSIGPLTTYSPAAPTTIVEIYANEKPAPATLPAAVTIGASYTPLPAGTWSGTPSSSSSLPASTSARTSPSPTTTSPTAGSPSVKTVTKTPTSSSTPVPPPSGGLSTGTKAGIGVGVALGASAVAVAAVFTLLRRRRAKKAQRESTISNDSDYPDKFTAYQGHSPYGPPDAPPQGYYHPTYGYVGVPALVHEAGSTPKFVHEAAATPTDEEHVRKVMGPRPTELQGEGDVPEMETTALRSPASPAPAYGDTKL